MALASPHHPHTSSLAAGDVERSLRLLWICNETQVSRDNIQTKCASIYYADKYTNRHKYVHRDMVT